MPVGWSDHTPGLTTALGAVALGAPMLEKHFTSRPHPARPRPPGQPRARRARRVRRRDQAARRRARRRRQGADALGGGERRARASLVARRDVTSRPAPCSTARTLLLLRPEGGISPAVDLRGRVVWPGPSPPAPRHRRDLAPSSATDGPEPATTVAVFVGTRADLGPLVARHRGARRGRRPRPARAHGRHVRRGRPRAGPAGDRVGAQVVAHRLASCRSLEPMAAVIVGAQLEQGAVLARAAGRVLRDEAADVLVVLGDRWELLYVVPPAVLARRAGRAPARGRGHRGRARRAGPPRGHQARRPALRRVRGRGRGGCASSASRPTGST